MFRVEYGSYNAARDSCATAVACFKLVFYKKKRAVVRVVLSSAVMACQASMEFVTPLVKRNRKTIHDASILELLECPVCLDLPRTGPIYNCKNGHLVCKNCYLSMDDNKCPTCRDKGLMKSVFAGRIADLVLKDVSMFCQFSAYGCKKEGKMIVLTSHEERCAYRDVYCPAKHRGVCFWQGSLNKMAQHFKESSCCIQPLHSNDLVNLFYFKSFIIDVDPKDISAFNRGVVSYWKPVMLISDAVFQYLLYLNIHRSAIGDWYLQVRSFTPKSAIDKIRVEISVFNNVDGDAAGDVCSESAQNNEFGIFTPPSIINAKQGNKKCRGLRYTYVGGVVSNILTNVNAIATGKYLLMKDAQVKQISSDSVIFWYSVKVWCIKTDVDKLKATKVENENMMEF